MSGEREDMAGRGTAGRTTTPRTTARRTSSRVSGAPSLIAVTVLAAVLCGAVAGVMTLFVPSQQSWQATTVLVVGGEANGGYRAAQTYALVLEESPTIIDAVAQTTGETAADAKNGLAVQAVQDTALLRVTYDAPTAEQATAALDALAEDLTAPGTTPLVANAPLVVLSGPSDPEEIGVSSALLVAAAVVVGAVLGLFVALAYRAVRPRARSRRQVESVTGAPVLGPVRRTAEMGAALRAVAATRPAVTPRVCVVVGPSRNPAALRVVAEMLRAGARSADLVADVVVHEAGRTAPRSSAEPGGIACHVVAQGAGEIAVAGSCDSVLLVVSTGSALAATADVVAQLAVVDRPVNLAVLVPPAVLSAAGATTDLRDSPVLAQPGR